jgi:hypothetical protein
VQVVGYRSVPPALLLAEEGTVERVALDPGTRLSYALGRRHCAGRLYERGADGPLAHERCEAPAAPYCDAHTVPWNVANNADSEEEHAVYLAAFAPATYKVGVTRTWRLETRLREQGADRAARVHTVRDGRAARTVESTLAARSGPDGEPVGERVRVAEKIAGFGRTLDEDAWERLLDGFDVEERYAFDYGLDVDGVVPETIASGTVHGVKGRVLVLDRAETTCAVDVRDLAGHEVETGGPADVQSSLGAFR